jgi:hypothetical protein
MIEAMEEKTDPVLHRETLITALVEGYRAKNHERVGAAIHALWLITDCRDEMIERGDTDPPPFDGIAVMDGRDLLTVRDIWIRKLITAAQLKRRDVFENALKWIDALVSEMRLRGGLVSV